MVSLSKEMMQFRGMLCGVGGWVGGLGGLGGLGKGGRGGWNEVLWVLYGWVGGWVREKWFECGAGVCMGRVGGWVGRGEGGLNEFFVCLGR